jgi:hypothetical protein
MEFQKMLYIKQRTRDGGTIQWGSLQAGKKICHQNICFTAQVFPFKKKNVQKRAPGPKVVVEYIFQKEAPVSTNCIGLCHSWHVELCWIDFNSITDDLRHCPHEILQEADIYEKNFS